MDSTPPFILHSTPLRLAKFMGNKEKVFFIPLLTTLLLSGTFAHVNLHKNYKQFKNVV